MPDIRSDIAQVIRDFDNIKNALNLLGMKVINDPTSTYGDKVKSLKNKIDRLNQLEEINSNNDKYFDDIYNAIVEKEQSPVKSDRSTYAPAIRAIKGGVELTNLDYFFYENCRSTDEYWGIVNSNIVSMYRMLWGASLTMGKTYNLDLSGCVGDKSLMYLIGSIKYKHDSSDPVKLVVKLGASNKKLEYFFEGNTTGSSLDRVNLIFDESSDASKLESLSQFTSRISLGELDVRALSKSPINNMYKAFYSDTVYISENLNLLDVSKVTTFSECFNSFESKLGSLDISSWKFNSAVNMYKMFESFKSNLIIGDISNVVNRSNMFKYCVFKSFNLKLSDHTVSKYNNDGFMSNCSLLERLTSDSDIRLLGMNNSSLFDNCSKLVSLPNIKLVYVNRSVSSERNIIYRAFRNCSSLTEVNVTIEDDSSVVDHVSQNGAYAFENCSALEYVHGNLDISRMDDLNGMFSKCSVLIDIDTTGGIANDSIVTKNNIVLDLSSSNVFDINSFINKLAPNNTGLVRTIKVSSVVYGTVSESSLALAVEKNYSIAS